MLHNNGPYGPNEAPVNMGASINVSQLSTPMNVVQNLNNLAKTPQITPQPGAGHFSLPNYPSYAGAPSHMGPQMHSYPSYHGLGFQPSYMPPSPPIMPSLNWQNGLLPMNLNMNSEHTQNMSNYSNFDRRASENHNSKEQSYPKVPLNVPHVPNNFFQRHFESDTNSQLSFTDPNKPIDSSCDTKPPEKLLNDNTRRKNLENTVRLIENILINTTKNRGMQQEHDSRLNNYKNLETVTRNSVDSNCSNDIAPTEIENDKSMESSRESPELDDEDAEMNSECSDEMPQTDETPQTDEIKVSAEQKEQHLDIEIKLEPEEVNEEEEVNEVEVKIEPVSSWTDMEHTAPFQKDINGVLQEDAGYGNIIDGDTSVAEAVKVIENREATDSYFECPYCSLLFKHPKRFLIHTKWHLFGLINERRVEIAKEKEMRKHQRKEARQSEKGGTLTRRTWPCKDCDKVFHARGGLESHRKRYHTNRIRECKMCAKTITGWGPWRAHLATHNTEAGYQCTHCPKRFKYSHSLSKHKDTHLEKTHECPECPKKFGSPALLKVHMKSHERQQKGASFHCSFCGKAFFDKFNLQIHERTHTNERPFVCEICNATFGCNSNLSRHMKVSHSSTKPYECSTCHRSFASEGIRDRHELRVHGDPEDFKYVCKQCPSRYMKQNELKKHTYKMHPKSKSKPTAENEDSK